MIPAFAPQLLSNDGLDVLRAAIGAPSRYAIGPKVDGVRALLTFGPQGIEVRGRKGLLRSSWLACRELPSSLETLPTGCRSCVTAPCSTASYRQACSTAR